MILGKQKEMEKGKEGSSLSQTITLLYSAKEDKFNNTVALKEYLEDKIKDYPG